MFNLLLTLLFIMQPTDKTKYQVVQKPVPVEQKVFDRDSVWRTDRPINARTQVNNRYLDWVVASVDTISIQDITPTTIDWYSYTVTGKYDFVAWNTDRIVIPQDWTYQIIVNFEWLSIMTIWWCIYSVNLNWSYLYWSAPAAAPSAFTTIQFVWVENLSRWDYLQTQVTQFEWSNKNIKVKISLIKLS